MRSGAQQLRHRGARVLVVIRPEQRLLDVPQLAAEHNGGNDASISSADLDTALEAVRDNVDFTVIRDAMETFQVIYVRDIIEIPLYYRKNVELHAPKVGNFFANPTQAGPTWNAVDWFVKG